jgi:peptidoglycan/LPS O-acetylase OafA/YrhL
LPPDFAPALRRFAVIGIVAASVPFFMIFKVGGFRHMPTGLAWLMAILVAAAAIGAILALQTDTAQNLKIPNPLHPDNRPSDAP